MSKRAEKAAQKIFRPINKAVVNLVSKPELINFQNLRMEQKRQYIAGYEQAEKDLGWHSVKESLPPVDEEVIVLTDDINGKIVPDAHRICYGHIIDKNIAADYDGWNIPGVKYWMCMPKLKEEEQ